MQIAAFALGSLAADDVGSWSIGKWIGVVLSIIVTVVVLVVLIVAAASSMDDCVAVLAVIVAFAFVCYIVWSWWLGPFVGNL